MKRRLFLATSLAALLAVPVSAQAPAASAPLKRDPVLRGKVDAAMKKAFSFLDKQQKPEGCWSTTEYPGLTALIVQAYLTAPGGQYARSTAVKKGLEFIRSNAKPDGSISAERMANYNTAICLAALVRASDRRDEKAIEAARSFLVGAQVKGAPNAANDGGFGYEPASASKPGRADLDNTVFVLEALKLHREANRTKEIPPGNDLNWQAASDFLARCQQLPSHNKEKWVSSLIYADLKLDDPRLLAARDWLTKHYTLEENPGQGEQGLYYYYHLMAKGLSALKVNELKTADGRSVNWRSELATKLLSLQKSDGSWASENARWMEKDPNLVTTYCLLALAYIHEQL